MTPSQELRWAKAAIFASDVTQSDLESTKGTPLKWVLMKAKEDSAKALLDLLDADPADTALIMTLQNEARRYRDFAGYVRRVISDGVEKGFQLERLKQEELSEVGIGQPIEGFED